MRQNADAPSGSVAAEHLDKMFAELDCAARIVRDKCDPVRLAARHPLATAAVSMGLGFFAARRLTGGTVAQAAPEAKPQARRDGGFPWSELLRCALTVAPLLFPKKPKPTEPPASLQPAESKTS
jgi:hypothetical protein